jgi:ketosteroid isomerase-like protein
MASANLDLVRSIFAAWEHGDFSSTGWAHRDIEFVIADGPNPGRWTGVAEMAEATRSRLRAWEDLRIEVDECSELDEERVLALTHAGGRGRTSGLELGRLRTKGASLFHVRGGKITQLVQYNDCDRALTELGLAPGADPSRP